MPDAIAEQQQPLSPAPAALAATGPAPAAPTGISALVSNQARVTALQRAAGRPGSVARAPLAGFPARPDDTPTLAALARVAGTRRTVARYEAGEHAQFGGQGTVMVNGVPIPAGNVIAMADFYRSPEAMNKADAAELTALNALIERDKNARLGVPGATAPSNDEIEQATAGRPAGERYMDLNKTNFSHFAPPSDPTKAVAGQDHKSAWEINHRKALDQAKKNAAPAGAAQASDPAKPDQGTVGADAKVTNLFAAHYLTDAFSAGHLVNKQEVMDKAKAYWDKVATHWGLPGTNDFTDKVAPKLMADPTVGGALAGQEIRLIQWKRVDAHRLSELLYGMSDDKDTKGDFFNLFARMVHDKLNRDGVEVSNGKKTWKLSGDATLNHDSLEQGQLAVAESEKNLQEAATTSGDLDYAAMFARVWALVPKPTTAGDAFVKQVVDTVGNAGKQEAEDELVRLAHDEIKTVIDQLKQQKRIRPAPNKGAVRSAPATGAGGAPPSAGGGAGGGSADGGGGAPDGGVRVPAGVGDGGLPPGGLP